MNPNFAIILNFLKGSKGSQGTNVKYYKREPKAKGGYRYWYTKEQYDKDHKKEEPKKEEQKAPSIWSKVASFFKVSPSEVKDKIESEYTSNLSVITKEVGPVTKQDFASHLAEYFANKSKWDSKFKGIPKLSLGSDKKKDPSITPVHGINGDGFLVVTGDQNKFFKTMEEAEAFVTTSKEEKTPKQKVAEQAEKFQDAKKWNLKLMQFIASKYSESGEHKSESEADDKYAKIKDIISKRKALPQEKANSIKTKLLDELKSIQSIAEFDAKEKEIMMGNDFYKLPVQMQNEFEEEVESLRNNIESPKSQSGTMEESKEDTSTSDWEKEIESKDTVELLNQRLGTSDPKDVADKLGIFKAEDIDSNIQYNLDQIESTRNNENLKVAEPYLYRSILQNHILDLKALRWLKENSPFSSKDPKIENSTLENQITEMEKKLSDVKKSPNLSDDEKDIKLAELRKEYQSLLKQKQAKDGFKTLGGMEKAAFKAVHGVDAPDTLPVDDKGNVDKKALLDYVEEKRALDPDTPSMDEKRSRDAKVDSAIKVISKLKKKALT